MVWTTAQQERPSACSYPLHLRMLKMQDFSLTLLSTYSKRHMSTYYSQHLNCFFCFYFVYKPILRKLWVCQWMNYFWHYIDRISSAWLELTPFCWTTNWQTEQPTNPPTNWLIANRLIRLREETTSHAVTLQLKHTKSICHTGSPLYILLWLNMHALKTSNIYFYLLVRRLCVVFIFMISKLKWLTGTSLLVELI